MREDVDNRVTKKEGEDIWKNFSNYAVYEDLRAIYQRCIPEIAKFEDKIKLVRDDVAQFTSVILRFDHNILEKVNKKQFDDFKIEVWQKFLQK